MTAILVALVIIVALAVAVAGASVRILREYERAVVFRLGRLVGAKGPGVVLLVPLVDRMVRVDLRTVTFEVPPQDVITRATLRVGRARAKTGVEALVGHVGVVRRAPTPLGQVFVDGALWQAKPCLHDELVVGDPVVVDHVQGLVLSVRRAEEWELDP